MKKFFSSIFSVSLLLCGLMVMLSACSRDGGDNIPEKPTPDDSNSGEVQQKGDSIFAKISQATGARIGQDLNGLKVGDSIYYNLTIDDPKAPKSATYTLDLDGVGSMQNHRRFNKDFTLHISKIADDGSTKDWHQVNSFPYVLPEKGRYRLMYVVNSDGTFIHEFKLQRRLNKEPHSKVTNLSVVFNVLAINLLYAVESTEDMYSANTYLVRYSLSISIKCGDFVTDKLFETGRSYSYKIVCDGVEYNDTFEPGVWKTFYNQSKYHYYGKNSGPEFQDKYISELVITVKPSNDAPPTLFQYKNLRMVREVNGRRKSRG
jgi:putative transcriptional antiterminator